MLEMYVQGVSTRKVKAMTEELCGRELSSSSVSRIVRQLNIELEKFAQRRLEEPYPYLVFDAHYEKVREEGAVRSQAVLVAIGINWEGRRSVLAVELASRESVSSWRELLLSACDNVRSKASSLWSVMTMPSCAGRFRRSYRKPFGNAVMFIF